MTDARATQVSLEEFASTNPPAQVTQVTVEQWVTTATVTGQALVTQVALEQWASVTPPYVELAGNLGGPSSYGRFHYGISHYSRTNAFEPIFSGALTVLFAPMAIAGNLSLNVALGASSFDVGPLWAAAPPIPPPWTPSKDGPPPPWMTAPPCNPVIWMKSRLCNG